MLAKTHRMAELLTQAMGPVFQSNPDYQTIMQAVGIAVARVAQCTPMAGTETKALNNICAYAEEALAEFLKIEEDKKAKLEQGIAGFADSNIIQFGDTKEGKEEKPAETEEESPKEQNSEEP